VQGITIIIQCRSSSLSLLLLLLLSLLQAIRKEKRSATADEQALIDEVEAAREIIIQVDSFKGLGQETGANFDQTKRPALDDIYGRQSKEEAAAPRKAAASA
jgi:hypothetical protein